MNAIFFYNLTARNGWRWRFEIITPAPTLLSSPQYIKIPDNVITSDITWQVKFPGLPLGLTDAPSVKLSFNMANLQVTPELAYLAQKLDAPFEKFDVPFTAGAPFTYDQYDPEQGTTQPITVVAQVPVVPKIRLTNVLRVMCNYGNPLTTFATMQGNDENATNSTMVFSGAQAVAPPSTYNSHTKTLTIEFLHLNKYVLENINPTMVDAQIRQLPPIYAKSVVLTGWKDPSGTQRIEIHECDGDENAIASNNVVLYRVQDLFSTISTLFQLIRKHLIRQDGFTWNGIDSYLSFARFYKTNLNDGQKGAVLPFAQLYFIGRVMSPYTGGDAPEAIAGTFAEGSAFYGFKNMWDFLFDVCECATKGLYSEFGLSPVLIYDIAPSSIETLTRDNFALDDESERQFNALGGYETAVADVNIAVSDFGMAQASETFNFVPYFHNIFREWDYAFCIDKDFDPIIRGFGANISELEGQLFYVEGGKAIAAHPACDFKNGASSFAQDPFNAAAAMPPETFKWLKGVLGVFIPDQGFTQITEKLNEFIGYWRGNLGVVRHIGYQVLSNFSSDKQRKFSGGFKVGNDSVTDLSMPLPRNTGRKYTITSDMFDPWIVVPTARVFLLSSELDIVLGVSKNELFAQDAPILITSL
jgi:hypothetical protein